MNKEEIIQKWLDGTLSKQERTLFEKSEEYMSITQLTDEVASLKAPLYNVEAELSELKQKITTRKSRSFNRSNVLLRVAAFAIVTIGLGYLFFPETNSVVEISSEEVATFNLPDNSKVKLNAESSISFDEGGWSTERQVRLTGEAYFDVTKGSLFEIETSSGVIRVLGTSFNVRDREGVLEVSCYTGMVSVSTNNGETILTAGQRVQVTESFTQEKTFLLSKIPSWINGKSVFQSASLSQVIKEFERQYKVEIELKDIDSTVLFTGIFTNTDLEIGLKSITLPLHLSYQITNNQIVLSKAGQ